MQSTSVNRIRIVYAPAEAETARLIAGACDASLQLADEMWGLEAPGDCRIHVMTAPARFFFQAAPWPWRLLLAITLPFWLPRARRTWPYSAAWTQRFGRRVVIGVKPPALLAQSDRSFGVRMFIEEGDPTTNLRHVTCHELTHACSARLALPAWLNEGIAVLTVERYLGKPVIRPDTLDLVRRFEPKGSPPTYRELSRAGGEALVYHAVRGYWLTRYLEESQPGFLRGRFDRRRDAPAWEREVAATLSMEPARLWQAIDGDLATHFGRADRDVGSQASVS